MRSPSVITPAGLGFVRVVVITPELRVADVAFNTQAIIDALARAATQGCRLALFPELSITGYSCADLFDQALLLDAAQAALAQLAAAAAEYDIAAVVGLPLPVAGKLYNCAAFLAGGTIQGIVPKTYLPTTGEFYEARWFTPATQVSTTSVMIGGASVPFGRDLLFAAGNLPLAVFGIEICEDLWAVDPPSGDMALAGATILLNLSASNELLGKEAYRRDLVRQQSARGLAAYLYAGSGPNESTTDVVWAGHSLIAENGIVLTETTRFQFTTQMALADIDVQRLVHERLRNSTYAASRTKRTMRIVAFDLPGPESPRLKHPTAVKNEESAPGSADRPDTMSQPGSEGSPHRDAQHTSETGTPWANFPTLLRPQLSRMPFVPADLARRAEHAREIFNIQLTGLAKRLKHTGITRVTIGVSGGLDSTLALLVTAKAFDVLGLPRTGIVAISMPGFGTTTRTRGNAARLAEALGVTLQTIPINEAVRQHFRDIGHDENVHDVTYENAQARERTQILMDVANQVGGLVVGTGDLSELALGWATYNGDHMSMYHVNAGVPKTLVRYLVEWTAEAEFSGETSVVLRDIVATPITPELLPLDANGALEQKTEETIGPYALHDFFLYYTVRFQFAPRKVFVLARQAFAGTYADAEILRWLEVFYRRFFSQQFKRSAMPDGPKVGSVALSPRGDWRMPSDASSALWLADVKALQASLVPDAGESH